VRFLKSLQKFQEGIRPEGGRLTSIGLPENGINRQGLVGKYAAELDDSAFFFNQPTEF
jgi:hypothetical protein